MSIAVALYWRFDKDGPAVFRIGARLLLGYSLLHLTFVNLLWLNPLSHRVHVGEVFIFNLLTLAYFVPGLLLVGASIISAGRAQRDRILPLGLTNFAIFVLLFTWLNFLVRHLFGWPEVYLSRGNPITEAELYTYSAAWLVVAVALIIYGLRANIRAVRVGALVLLGIVVAKVFLVDMSELAGIYRVISFLGLGAGLLGLGYAYQRFVSGRDNLAPEDDKPEATD